MQTKNRLCRVHVQLCDFAWVTREELADEQYGMDQSLVKYIQEILY